MKFWEYHASTRLFSTPYYLALNRLFIYTMKHDLREREFTSKYSYATVYLLQRSKFRHQFKLYDQPCVNRNFLNFNQTPFAAFRIHQIESSIVFLVAEFFGSCFKCEDDCNKMFNAFRIQRPELVFDKHTKTILNHLMKFTHGITPYWIKESLRKWKSKLNLTTKYDSLNSLRVQRNVKSE